jgi:hypothetical protein
MGVDHLGVGQLRQELDRSARTQRRQAKATLQNASIGRAGIRVYDGGWIRIEDGGLQVTGTASVTGTLTGSGTFDWTGPWNLLGNGEVAGNVSLTGKIQVGDVTIDGGTGEIRVAGSAPIRLRTVGGGAVIEVGGTTIREQDGLLKIDAGSGVGIFQDSFSLQLKSGGVAFAVGGFGPQIIGLPTAAQVDYPGSFPGALVANSTGQLFRVI